MRRDDLFTVVHEQFFTDTADYADILLPAPTFLETKDVQGAYGHLFAQICQQAIAPLGEARNNVAALRRTRPAHGLSPNPASTTTDDDLIDQALDTQSSRGSPASPASAWSAKATSRWRCRRTPTARSLPFSTRRLVPHAQRQGRAAARARSSSRRSSRAPRLTPAYPLEFLPRKADNYMNSTFANQPGHQRMEAATAGILEMHADDAAARGDCRGRRGRGLQRPRPHRAAGAAERARSAKAWWPRASTGQSCSDLSGRGANVNALTSERLTDIGGGATFYSTLVEVRRVGALEKVH